MPQPLMTAIGITVLIVQPLVTFSIGVETGGPQLRSLFARPGLTLRYFLATFVVMPAIAIVCGAYGWLSASIWPGLALMSIAPPAPPSTRRLRKMGNFDVGLAWQAEAFVLSIVTMPLTVAIVAHLGLLAREINLNWQPVLLRSILFFGAPMLLGLLVRRYWAKGADALSRPVGIAANAGLLVLVVLVLVVAVPVIWRFGILPIGVILAFVAIAVVVGHLMGGPGRDTRVTLAAMLAARFPVPAMVLAQANGELKAVLPIVLVYVIGGAVLVPIYAKIGAGGSAA
jgi:bile acid:Na+ symporter, BASS family